MIEIAKKLWLGRVALGPLPLVFKLGREGIGVFLTLDVDARARIAVPEPCPADAAASLIDARRQPQLAHLVQHVEAGKARADDYDVIAHLGRHFSILAGLNLARRE